MGDWIKEGFDYILYNFIYRIFYLIEAALCLAISWMQKLFNVFTGLEHVTYDGKSDVYLIDVFFGNKITNALYLGFSAIGIVFISIFTVAAVVKKAADLDDKVKQSYGQIIRGLIKAILLIASMNLIMTMCIDFTNGLMISVDREIGRAHV